jgi:hypothetical protein
MSHAFTLALVYALVMHAACLLHAASAGWAALRQVPTVPATLIGASLATALGMALAAAVVTATIANAPETRAWLGSIGWLGGSCLLVTALFLYEATRAGRLWRAMGADADGLVAIGIKPRFALALGQGIGLAVLAGILAPPRAVVDWLPLAGLALLVLALPDRPRARAIRSVLLAWLIGALIGGLELVLQPLGHALVVGLLGLLAARVAAPHLARAGAQ